MCEDSEGFMRCRERVELPSAPEDEEGLEMEIEGADVMEETEDALREDCRCICCALLINGNNLSLSSVTLAEAAKSTKTVPAAMEVAVGWEDRVDGSSGWVGAMVQVKRRRSPMTAAPIMSRYCTCRLRLLSLCAEEEEEEGEESDRRREKEEEEKEATETAT